MGGRRGGAWTRGTRSGVTAVLAALALVADPGSGAAEWTVTLVAGVGCVLESTPATLSDGYQPTTARIRVGRKTVSISSASVMDAGFNDIGIVVDQQDLLPADRLADARTAVFESHYGTLVDQFKRGARARLQLRFWPTWPVTGTHDATVSLIGFTRAYARLEDCK